MMGVGVGAQTLTVPPSGLRSDLDEILSGAGPKLLFGFRLWASVCLALFVAYYLELPNASWAGTSAAIMCQPQLGASLRKGWYLMIGTVIGAIMIVVLTAVFPQERAGFFLFLSLWCGACAYFATQLKNFESYAAALAGYTPLIVAANVLGATGGPDSQVFMVAVTRATEICIGIVSAGLILAGTDLGTARRQLAMFIAGLASEITAGFIAMLEHARMKSALLDAQMQRRAFAKKIVALDPAVDQAIGESSELRYNLPVLQRAMCGLFASTDGWRTIGAHFTPLADEEAQRQADAVLATLPIELRKAAGCSERWLADPAALRESCDVAQRALMAGPVETPWQRLLADQTARFLEGVMGVLAGLILLLNKPVKLPKDDRRFHLTSPDWAPALVNAARAMIAVSAGALFWIVTAWPSGALAMTFVTIAVMLLSPRGDMAPAAATGFAIGSLLAIPFAAIMKFAILPSIETPVSFCIAFAFYLVPVGFLVAQINRPALSGIGTVMAFVFVFLLDPENEIAYDTLALYNSALAIFAGCAAASLFFQLVPPLAPAVRAKRLVAFALEDVRAVAMAPVLPRPRQLEQRMYSRLAALPDKADPACSTQLLSAMRVGSEVVHLRELARSLPLGRELDAALRDLSEGHSEAAIARFEALDRDLALVSMSTPTGQLALEARARILAITETISQHADYFDEGGGR
jgi:uncharacterized membrane protein YccC